MEPTGGLLSRTLRRLTESSDERARREAGEEHERLHPGEAVTAIDDCHLGEQVTVTGRVHAIDVRPEGSAPALEATIDDGSGVLYVVWLGRRRIPGIHEGRAIVVHGRLNCVTEHPTIYNPRYELLPE